MIRAGWQTLAGSHQAQVTLVGAGREQVGEDELRERGAGDVARVPSGDQVGTQASGGDQPAETQPGRQRFGRAAGVRDVIRGGGLLRRNRWLVIAMLGVLVVLDDQAVAFVRPRQQLAAPRRRKHDTHGELVRRCGHDDPLTARREIRDD